MQVLRLHFVSLTMTVLEGMTVLRGMTAFWEDWRRWDREALETSIRASKWPDLRATCPGLPSSSSIEAWAGEVQMSGGGTARRTSLKKRDAITADI